jgi:Na+-driven multidrug efflux pump
VVFLPAAWVLGPGLGFGMTAVWVAHVAYRGVQTLVFIAMWQGDRWTNIAV